MVKLRLRSPLSGTANSFTRMFKLTTCCLLTPSPCVTCTYPILSSLLSSTPPRHEYILNGTWRSHLNLPCGLSLQVYTQYPRPEVFPMTSSFLLAFISLITLGLIRNLFRLVCFVNSSLRSLILNLHPICTCSC